MNSAQTKDGRIIKAYEYQSEKHGDIYCIDKICKVPLIYISAAANTSAHFKTTGKGDSIHHGNCIFARTLGFEESIVKVHELQKDFIEKKVDPIIIRVNLNRIDPDYEARPVEREQKPFDPSKIIVKQDSSNATKSISSLKSIVKLMELNQPDLLASVFLTIKGNRLPLTELIITPDKAFELLYQNKLLEKTPYFIYGTIKQFLKRDKVYFINFNSENKFSLVVFEKYFSHFTYTEGQLQDRLILAYGFIKKNEYNGQSAEMSIKANSYLEYLR